MAVSKIIGYVLSVVGLAAIALSSRISKMLSILGDKSLTYTIVGSIILIITGIALVLSDSSFGSSKVKQAEAEVPIYEGEGKKRKIVGYQRAK